MTSAVCSSDCKSVYTASKDGSIRKWDARTGKRLLVLPKARPEREEGAKSKGKGKGKTKAEGEVEGHSDEVLALALSYDGKFLVSGGKDRRVIVWDAKDGKWLKTFLGHKDTISVRMPLLRQQSVNFNLINHFLLSVLNFPPKHASTLYGFL